MKTLFKLLALLLIAVSCSKEQADVTGHWEGIFVYETYEYSIQFDIHQINTDVYGNITIPFVKEDKMIIDSAFVKYNKIEIYTTYCSNPFYFFGEIKNNYTSITGTFDFYALGDHITSGTWRIYKSYKTPIQ